MWSETYTAPPSMENKVYMESLQKTEETRIAMANRGVPQGAPTSPFLSNLAMAAYARAQKNALLVIYADDFVKVGRKLGNRYVSLPKEKYLLNETPLMKDLGISYSPEKSGWVKKDGE